jgi:hypothetical protein
MTRLVSVIRLVPTFFFIHHVLDSEVFFLGSVRLDLLCSTKTFELVSFSLIRLPSFTKLSKYFCS